MAATRRPAASTQRPNTSRAKTAPRAGAVTTAQKSGRTAALTRPTSTDVLEPSTGTGVERPAGIDARFAGHASQEAREHIGLLNQWSAPRDWLVPDTDRATGLRDEPARASTAFDTVVTRDSTVHPAMLEALKDTKQPTVLLQHFMVDGRGVVAGLVLPAKFDASKPVARDIVTLFDPAPAQRLSDGDFVREGGEHSIRLVVSERDAGVVDAAVLRDLVSQRLNLKAAPAAEARPAPEPAAVTAPARVPGPMPSRGTVESQRPTNKTWWTSVVSTVQSLDRLLPWRGSRWRSVDQAIAQSRTQVDAANVLARSLQHSGIRLDAAGIEAVSTLLKLADANAAEAAGSRFGLKAAEASVAAAQRHATHVEALLTQWQGFSRSADGLQLFASQFGPRVNESLASMVVKMPAAERTAVLEATRAVENAVADFNSPLSSLELASERLGTAMTAASKADGLLKQWLTVNNTVERLQHHANAVVDTIEAIRVPGAMPIQLPAEALKTLEVEAAAISSAVGALRDGNWSLAERQSRSAAVDGELTSRIHAFTAKTDGWARLATRYWNLTETLNTAADNVAALKQNAFGPLTDKPARLEELLSNYDVAAKAMERLKTGALGQAEALKVIEDAQKTAANLRELGEWRKAADSLNALVVEAPSLRAAAETAERFEFLPFEGGGNTSSRVREAAKSFEAAAAPRAGQKLTLAAVKKLAVEMKGDAQAIRDGLAAIGRGTLGTRPVTPTADPKSIGKLKPKIRADVQAVIQRVPETKAALELLATMRPEVFSSVDPLTKKPFAAALVTFVDTQLRRGEAAGLAEFIRRVAVRRYDWRQGGYSHSVTTAMTSVFNQPGLILELISATRDLRSIPVKGVFEGDGARSIEPSPDFDAGFNFAPKTSRHSAADLGYERAFLRLIRDEDQLAPNASKLPRDRFARICDPVAVGLSKVLGTEIRYAYAYKLVTGEDLAEAIETQGGAGLTFGDVTATIRGQTAQLHFPVFYDYDPKTRTVALQEWRMGEQRISIDDIHFPTNVKARPAIYYRPTPAMDKFLTPEFQSNWEYLRSQGAQAHR